MLMDGQSQLDALVMAAPTMPVMEISPELKAYLTAVASLSETLAKDDLATANTAVAKLPPAPDKLIQTPPPAPNSDIKELRKAFLPWSQEIATLATGMNQHFPELKIFRCPMTHELWPGAPADAKWIQLGGELRNPYWGKEMQECGVEVKP